MKLPNLKFGFGQSGESFVKKRPGLVLYLLITLLIVALYMEQGQVFEKYEKKIENLMFSFRGEQNISDEVVLLNIDDPSIDYLGKWPWSHHTLAQLIEALDYYQPRVLYLNFPIEPNMDDYVSGNSQLLAENILQAKNVIIPFNVMLGPRTPRTRTSPQWLKNSAIEKGTAISREDVELAVKVELPEEMFGQAAKYVGADITYFEKDNSVHAQPLAVKYENKIYPSTELVAASAYLGIQPSNIIFKPGQNILLGERTIDIDRTGKVLINYLGPENSFPNHSVRDLWEGKIPVEKLENKLVIVNLNATGYYDPLETPLSNDLSKGEKTATVAYNIIKRNFINKLHGSSNFEIFLILAIGLFCAIIVPRVILLHRIIVLMVFLFALVNINFIMFSSFNTLVKTFYPALQICLFMIAAPMMKDKKGVKKSKKREQTLKFEEIKTDETAQVETVMIEDPKEKIKDDSKVSEDKHKTDKPQAKPLPDEKPENVETVEFSEFEHSSRNIDDPVISDEESTEPQGEEINQLDADIPVSSQSDAKITFDKSGQPSQFGRYEIVETIGQGAMGTVYKGLDPAIGRPVALKTIRFDRLADPSEIDELKHRFMLEAKAAGNFSHPNIVTIYDVGQDKNIQYIAMEYLEGRPLDLIIKRKLKLNFRIVASIIMQVANALAYAHERQIVHRDIKPANIMVLDNFNVKVMDFGIAHFESSNITQTGVAMGTPNYISPEQLSGKEVTNSSDIFSLGVVMYELLTGTKPFVGDNISNLILQILQKDPDPPSKIAAKVPPLLDHIVMKALEKDSMKRYQSAKEISSALREFVSSFSTSTTGY